MNLLLQRLFLTRILLPSKNTRAKYDYQNNSNPDRNNPFPYLTPCGVKKQWKICTM